MNYSRISLLIVILSIVLQFARAQGHLSGISVAKYPAHGKSQALQNDSFLLANVRAWGKSISIIQAVMQADGFIVVMAASNDAQDYYTWNAQPTEDSLMLFSTRFTPDGQLDTTYGQHGWVRYQLPYSTPARQIRAAMQADGKWVVAHGFSDLKDIAIMRFEQDGQLDTSFREVGFGLVTNPDSNGDELGSVSILADGKIQLIAYSRYGKIDKDARVIRFTPQGRLDTSFRHGGKVIFAERPWIGDCRMLPDGRFVLVCYDNDWLKVERYLPDGSIDVSYGYFGQVVTHIQTVNSEFWSLQPDGSLFIFGNESMLCTKGTTETAFRVRRFDARGRRDDHFHLDEENWLSNQFISLHGACFSDDSSWMAFDTEIKGQKTLNFYSRQGALLSQKLNLSGLFDYSSNFMLPSPQGGIVLIGHRDELIVIAHALPEGQLNPHFGVDSASIAVFGYELLTTNLAENTRIELKDTTPPLYTIVSMDVDSPTFYVVDVDDQLQWNFDKITPDYCNNLACAINQSKAGRPFYLRLKNEVFPDKEAAWADIPADKLVGLSLSNCRFNGPVPPQLKRFKDLQLLEIKYDSLQPDDLAEALALIRLFPNLRRLVIKTPGKIQLPPSFYKLQQLTSLYLDMPDLLHFPEGITRLKKLRELQLRFVCPQGLPASIVLLDSLQVLKLTGSGQQSRLQLPETIGNLKQLKFLSLNDGAQTVKLPASIGRLKALETFKAELAGINALPESFADCEQLKELSIVTAGYFEPLPERCALLPNLSSVKLEVCQPANALRFQCEQLKTICSSRGGNVEFRLY